MKVEYVESFVQAACAVLEQLSGCGVTPGALDLRGTVFPSASVNIVSVVNGALSGGVVYSMTCLTAQKLAGMVVGSGVHGFGKATGNGLSAIGQMLADRTRESLAGSGFDCEINGPVVFQGMNVEFSVSAPALAVSIDTGMGQVDVNVAVRNGQSN